MEAIVMAAGEGRRLRPVTERFAKPVLPIDGRPVISTLLRQLAAAGIARVTVVTGHLAEQVEALVGGGSGFGLELAFARQPRPDGSADAVRCALAAGGRVPALLAAADTAFRPDDVARFAAAFGASGAAGALAVRRDPPPGAGKPAVLIRDGLVRRVVAIDPSLPLSSAPLWGLGGAVAPFLDDLPGPPFELKDAYQRAIDAGHPVAAIEIGSTRDLTTPIDLALENFPYLRAL